MNTKQDRSINKPTPEFAEFLKIFNASRMAILYDNSKLDERWYQNQGKGMQWDGSAMKQRLETAIHADPQGQKENLRNFFDQEIPSVLKNNTDVCLYLFGIKTYEQLSEFDTHELLMKGYRYLSFGRALLTFEELMERVDSFHEESDLEKARKKFSFAIAVVNEIVINDKGKTEERDFEFINFTGIEIGRLKRCLNCKTVFWAYRLNAKYCAESCSDTYHRKIYLSNESKRTALNQQRRITYARKNEQKQAKANHKGE